MSGENVDEVVFAALQNRDCFVMETGRSTYSFTVTDKTNRRGLLIGGNVAEARQAVFSGSLNDGREIWEHGVRLGERATFFLVSSDDPSGFRQVITSRLVRIRLIRSGQTASY